MNMFFEHMNVMVQPMREELTRYGFQELKTEEEVDQAIQNSDGVSLVVVNSVCGCAAGIARPAAAISLQHEVKPDHIYTVFAGQDKEATVRAREYFVGEPPSSPSMALMKDGKLLAMVHRHQIEDHSAEEVVQSLTQLYDQHCK